MPLPMRLLSDLVSFFSELVLPLLGESSTPALPLAPEAGDSGSGVCWPLVERLKSPPFFCALGAGEAATGASALRIARVYC